MKTPTQFLQGFGIGASLAAVVAAISLMARPGVIVSGPTRPVPAGEPAIEPREAGATAATHPEDYLDLCRNAGL